MTCSNVTLPGGQRAIVCTKTVRCPCKRRADLACDWKVPTRASGTCDKPLCSRCTFSPAPGKDLCPKHRTAFEAWKATR
jgi:hypothetical protein